jgi:methylthioribulose-1-phosphate dehydratase
MSAGHLYSRDTLRDAVHALIATGEDLGRRGMTPATSGNFSIRLDAEHLVVTASGRDKGALSEADFVVVTLDGEPVPGSAARPSAETFIHAELYRRDLARCVLHTHSHNQTVASRLFARDGHVRLAQYELLKAFAGTTTHDVTLDVPVLQNSQDLRALAAEVGRRVDTGPLLGFLINGHGLYAWGQSVAEARRHLDAFEFLLACELDERRLR